MNALRPIYHLNLITIMILSCCLFTGCGVSVSKMDIAKLNQRAAVYMEQGDYDNAIARLIAINDLEDNHPEVYYNLGIAYIKKEDYEKAVDSLKEAISLKPDMVDAYYSLGVTYELFADKQIEEMKKATNSSEKFKLKTQIAQNIQNATSAYSSYLQIAPEGVEKNQIKSKLEYLPQKYKTAVAQPVNVENPSANQNQPQVQSSTKGE